MSASSRVPPDSVRARRRKLRVGIAAALIALPLLAWLGVMARQQYQAREQARVEAENQARRHAEAQKQQEEAREAQLTERTRQAVLTAQKLAAEQDAQDAREARAREIAQLTVADYAYAPAEAPAGRKRWLFGYRQGGRFYAFDAAAKCGKELLHRDAQVLYPEFYGPAATGPKPGQPPGMPAVTVPAAALAPLRAAGMHLPRTWTVVTAGGAARVEMTAMATAFDFANGPCLYLLSAPFVPEKEQPLTLWDERPGQRLPLADLALAYPDEIGAGALREVAAPVWLNDDAARAAQHERNALALLALREDPLLKPWLARLRQEYGGKLPPLALEGFQAFHARLAADRGEELFYLYRYVAHGELEAAFWVIMRDADQKVIAAEPVTSREDMVPEIVAVADLDGDGIDELLWRAYLWNEGRQLRLFALREGRLRLLGESSYTGL